MSNKTEQTGTFLSAEVEISLITLKYACVVDYLFWKPNSSTLQMLYFDRKDVIILLHNLFRKFDIAAVSYWYIAYVVFQIVFFAPLK